MLVCGVSCEEPLEVDIASSYEAHEADNKTPHATADIRDAPGPLAKAGHPGPGDCQDRGEEPGEDRCEEPSTACC